MIDCSLGNHIVTEKRWERTNEHQSDCNNHLRLRSRSQEKSVRLSVFRISNLRTARLNLQGTNPIIVKANLWLRCAGRVWVKMGTFTAVTFTELFDRTKALPWGDWIPEDGKFTVVGKSVKSTLFSVSDCQAIVKKAVVEKLKEKYKTDLV